MFGLSLPILPTASGCKIEYPSVALAKEGLLRQGFGGLLNFVPTYSGQNWHNHPTPALLYAKMVLLTRTRITANMIECRELFVSFD